MSKTEKKLISFLLDEISKARAEAFSYKKINEMLNKKLTETQDDE